MLPNSQRTLILVLEHMGNFGVRLPPGCSRHGVSVHCLCVQMLCKPLCHRMTGVSKMCSYYVMLPLWDFHLEWCFADVNGYSSVGYGSFVRPCRSLCGITYLFSIQPIYFSAWNRWHIMANTLKMLTSYLSNVHYTRMFSLLVEYGLMLRGDCINCETCYFCFDPAFVWPSLGRADFDSA